MVEYNVNLNKRGGRLHWLFKEFGDKKVFIKKNKKGKIYCPNCCAMEWRKRKKIVPFFLGILKKTIEEDYLYHTPESDYPDRYSTKRADYCGNCKQMLAVDMMRIFEKC